MLIFCKFRSYERSELQVHLKKHSEGDELEFFVIVHKYYNEQMNIKVANMCKNGENIIIRNGTIFFLA